MTFLPECPIDLFGYIYVEYYRQSEQQPVVAHPYYPQDVEYSGNAEFEVFIPQ
jgi:hypothetical protein